MVLTHDREQSAELATPASPARAAASDDLDQPYERLREDARHMVRGGALQTAEAAPVRSSLPSTDQDEVPTSPAAPAPFLLPELRERPRGTCYMHHLKAQLQRAGVTRSTSPSLGWILDYERAIAKGEVGACPCKGST